MQVTNPIHKPCPDMAGMANPDPKKLKRSLFLLEKLREKHGIKKPSARKSRPLQYVCTSNQCEG
jgi:hypothetical protein